MFTMMMMMMMMTMMTMTMMMMMMMMTMTMMMMTMTTMMMTMMMMTMTTMMMMMMIDLICGAGKVFPKLRRKSSRIYSSSLSSQSSESSVASDVAAQSGDDEEDTDFVFHIVASATAVVAASQTFALGSFISSCFSVASPGFSPRGGGGHDKHVHKSRHASQECIHKEI